MLWHNCLLRQRCCRLSARGARAVASSGWLGHGLAWKGGAQRYSARLSPLISYHLEEEKIHPRVSNAWQSLDREQDQLFWRVTRHARTVIDCDDVKVATRIGNVGPRARRDQCRSGNSDSQATRHVIRPSEATGPPQSAKYLPQHTRSTHSLGTRARIVIKEMHSSHPVQRCIG